MGLLKKNEKLVSRAGKLLLASSGACSCCGISPCNKCSATGGAILPQLPCVIGCAPDFVVASVSGSVPAKVVQYDRFSWVRHPAFSFSGTVTCARNFVSEPYQGCGYGFGNQSGEPGISCSAPFRNAGLGLFPGYHDRIGFVCTLFLCLQYTYDPAKGDSPSNPYEGYFSAFPCPARPDGGANLSPQFNGVIMTPVDAANQYCWRSGSGTSSDGYCTVTILSAY